jgi:hypothetical protein
MSSVRRRLKNNKPPEGWELIEEVIEDFELQVIGQDCSQFQFCTLRWWMKVDMCACALTTVACCR